MFLLTVVGIWIGIKSCQLTNTGLTLAANDQHQDSIIGKLVYLIELQNQELDEVKKLTIIQSQQLASFQEQIMYSSNISKNIGTQLGMQILSMERLNEEAAKRRKSDSARLFATFTDIKPLLTFYSADLISVIDTGNINFDPEGGFQVLVNRFHAIMKLMENEFGNEYLLTKVAFKKCFDVYYRILVSIQYRHVYGPTEKGNLFRYWKFNEATNAFRLAMDHIENDNKRLVETTFYYMLVECSKKEPGEQQR